MEGPISYWGHKEKESNLILPEHDDDEAVHQVGFALHEYKIYSTWRSGAQDLSTPEYNLVAIIFLF